MGKHFVAYLLLALLVPSIAVAHEGIDHTAEGGHTGSTAPADNAGNGTTGGTGAAQDSDVTPTISNVGAKFIYPGQEGTNYGHCPKFNCTPGARINGSFTDSDSEDVSYEFIYSRPLIPFDAESPEWDPELKDPFFACWKVCKDFGKDQDQEIFGKEQPKEKIKYWQYEETCEEGAGGVCSCYDEGVCTTKHYNRDNSMTKFFDTTGDYQPPSVFYVGKICDSNGTGDPHFVGADHSRYDFGGVPNESFALISDAHVAVNAFFGGRYDTWMGQKNKVMTWMRKVSVLWGHHAIVFEARSGADASYGEGYLKSVTVDGEPTSLTVVGQKVYLFDGQIELKWAAAAKKLGTDLVDEYEVTVADIIALKLTLRPEIEMMRTKDDGLVHFTVDVISAQLSANVHGVLGQTYRPDFAGKLEKQTLVYSKLLKAYMVPGDNAEGFIDGTVSDYQVTDLLRSDCNFCRFVRSTSIDDETAKAVSMATTVSSSYSSLGRKGMINLYNDNLEVV